MKRKTLLATLAFCTSFSCATAYAADAQSYTINLSAKIPSDTFMVIPVDPGWINQTQDMGYDISTKKLNVFKKQFQYKNSAGPIRATLTGNLNSEGKPQLSNGTDVIPLAVTFNRVALSNTATTVVEAAPAKAGSRAELVIAQDEDKPLTINGSFSGSVAMIFEPEITN